MLINSRPVMRTGPEVPQEASSLPVPPELELELIQPHMAQKPVLRGEVGCACVAREVSVPPRPRGR